MIAASLRRLIELNQAWSRRLEIHLPQARNHPHQIYEDAIGALMNQADDVFILDVGAGKQCPFAKYRQIDRNTRIVGLDVSAEEMSGNVDVDEKLVWDARDPLPVEDNSVNLITSRSVLEHFPIVAPFHKDSFRALAPGGTVVHAFPSKWAPFAIINRIIPNWLAKRLIATFLSDSKDELGFVAFYDQCTESDMKRVLESSGLEIVESHVGYYQARYFSFCFPLYVAMATWELVVMSLGRRQLAATVLVVAEKPGG